jgi:L-fucose isomerase-like protein
MQQKIKIGVVCLTRNTFDYNAAQEIYEKILGDLALIDNLELIAISKNIMEIDEAVGAGKLFAEKQVDGIAVISGTFHLGHLVLEIKNKCDKPLLLWGLPELPYNGGKIRLNSVCGVNLNASNLTKSGYTDFSYIISNSIDTDWLAAVRMKTALKEARIGIIGYRAHGFFNVGIDELGLYKKYGCIVDHYELSEVFEFEASQDRINYFGNKIEKHFDLKEISEMQSEKVAVLAAKLESFMQSKNLSMTAIRCWPEFAQGFGIAPCASMSILQDEGFILACEGDIDCGITMLCHAAAGANSPFMADLSQVNIEQDFALMWHCGVAPCSLIDGVCTPTLDTYFAGGRGVTAGFVMKSGDINCARLDSVNGHYRLFMEKGKAVPMEKQLTGTYAKCIFEKGMKNVLDKVVYSGIAHHVSMVYGDYTKAFEIFARLTDTEIL